MIAPQTVFREDHSGHEGTVVSPRALALYIKQITDKNVFKYAWNIHSGVVSVFSCVLALSCNCKVDIA